MPNSITSRCRLRSFPAGRILLARAVRVWRKNSLSRLLGTGLNKVSIYGFTSPENLQADTLPWEYT